MREAFCLRRFCLSLSAAETHTVAAFCSPPTRCTSASSFPSSSASSCGVVSVAGREGKRRSLFSSLPRANAAKSSSRSLSIWSDCSIAIAKSSSNVFLFFPFRFRLPTSVHSATHNRSITKVLRFSKVSLTLSLSVSQFFSSSKSRSTLFHTVFVRCSILSGFLFPVWGFFLYSLRQVAVCILTANAFLFPLQECDVAIHM